MYCTTNNTNLTLLAARGVMMVLINNVHTLLDVFEICWRNCLLWFCKADAQYSNNMGLHVYKYTHILLKVYIK